MSPLLQCGLQVNGICSKISRTLREGPKSSMALQMKCMFKMQGVLALEKYLTFRQHDGILGKMIRLSEELLRIETDLPGNIFKLDYNTYQILASPSWIKSIWMFVDKFKIQINMKTASLQETKVDDLFIMKEFVTQGIKGKKLKHLMHAGNTC